jgi:hypothetical protein
MVKLLLLMLLCIEFVGCGGGTSAISNNSPVLVQSIPLYANGLNGNGNIIAASYTDQSGAGATTGFKETLNIYQQDSVNPDLLLNLGSVYLGVDTLYHRLADVTLNAQWATVTMNDNLLTQGWVALVPLSGPSYSLSATLLINATLDRAVAMGNWLLIASSTSVALYDITTPSAPVLKTSFPLSASTTSMIALANGFFVISNNGYGYMDVSNPLNITFTEAANADIKASQKANLIGNKIYIGGPSKYAGKVKIARVDVTVPGTPIVDIINDQINGTFVDFSYDSVDSYYLQMTDSVQLYKETNGVLSLNKSASLMSNFNNASQLHAYNGRFYIGKWGMKIYRMP